MANSETLPIDSFEEAILAATGAANYAISSIKTKKYNVFKALGVVGRFEPIFENFAEIVAQAKDIDPAEAKQVLTDAVTDLKITNAKIKRIVMAIGGFVAPTFELIAAIKAPDDVVDATAKKV